MRLAIKGSEPVVAEMRDTYPQCDWVVVENSQEVAADKTFLSYFQLDANAITDDYSGITIPVFIHSVADTLQKLRDSSNMVRINAWPGFLKRKNWEVAGNLTATHEAVLTAMNIQISRVADTPGMIAARVLSMIINEAFFALEEGVSTRNEIDVAMKLGTGYPMGPFEWAERIGHHEVINLLNTLMVNHSIYRPANMLLQQR